ncbi:hypothetical protein Pint_10925 [Pistacia integerrima]|uniref:Uncharacterized protein n=1 Tax=Pistacia integerrima TaxID=434235 RepID=A0ACC0XFZ4_9ROSI|nr:hypothetical protein Pint_10925 [Pistacia integerrima]
MALLSRLRTNLSLNSLKHRHFSASSILASGDSSPLTSKEKTRAALSLLRSESNPERILDICRAASLTPDSHLDRIALSNAISKLSQANHFNGIAQFLEELKARPDLRRNERFICHSIVLYGQANMMDHAVRTFKEMENNGVSHSVKSLNALIFACILAKDYKEVKRIFVEFPKIYKIEPNLETYNTVIKAFCESDESSSVYSVLAEMDRKSVCKESMEKGWVPNFSTMKLLVNGLASVSRVDEAKELIGAVKEKFSKNGDMWNEVEAGLTQSQLVCNTMVKGQRIEEIQNELPFDLFAFA